MSKIELKVPDNIDEITFLAACRKQDEFDDRISKINGERNKFRKDLQTRGIVLGEFDAVRKLRKEDPEDIKISIQTRARYMMWLKMPVGTQKEMFPTVHKDPSKEYADGFQAGIKGLQRKPPEKYGPTSKIWLEAYDDGQKNLAYDMFNKDYSQDDADDQVSEGPSSEEPKSETPSEDVDLVEYPKDTKPKAAEAVNDPSYDANYAARIKNLEQEKEKRRINNAPPGAPRPKVVQE